MPEVPNGRPANALGLLLKVHLVQIWRRLKSVRGKSTLLTGVVGAFIGGYLILSFWLFLKALQFLAAFPGLGTVLTERLMYLLFAFLFAMLLLSNLVISYTNFFRNREAAFLMTLPIPRQTIFQWKFIESVALASWGFLFLIAPLLAAFGLTRAVPWHFYVATVVLTGLFIILPGVAGAWMAVQLARRLDRRSFQIALVAAGAAGLVIGRIWWRMQPESEEIVETRVLEMLDQLLTKTRFAQFPFLPSYWLSSSILQWADGVLATASFFGLVLLSNVAFFGFAVMTRMGNLFYDTASTVQSRGSIWRDWIWSRARSGSKAPFRFSVGLAERLVGLVPGMKPATRGLIVKDIRTFWRDTTQWGQSVMLFGLLAVYVLNLRHFTQQLNAQFWVNLVAYLNLGACSLNLATVTTRFVFPQFSLEGRRLWVVGMAPMGLARVVKTKYWLASCCSLLVTLTLITLSSILLKMPPGRILFFSVVVTVMTFSLNGLAVGLGVLYPSFQEPNPSKIVSGFGGTLCLVLSFLYILASILILGLGTPGAHTRVASTVTSLAVFAVLSASVGWLPLKLGARQLRHLEV